MKFVHTTLAVLGLFTLGACSTGTSIYQDTNTVDTRTAGVSDTDIKMLTDEIINDLLVHPAITRMELPVTISLLRIVNNTSEFVDTDALIGDKIITSLIRNGAGTFEFVDRDLVDAAIQEAELGSSGLVSQDEATQLGRMAGARLLMTGELTSIRSADSRTDQRYYKLNLRLVDTERNTIVWINEKDIRKATQKGWMQ